MKLKNEEASYWDEQGYDALVKKKINSHRNNIYQINILEKIKLDQQNILEIGPGLGQDLKYFARHQCKIHALDVSSKVINKLKKNFDGSFIVGDVRDITSFFNKKKFVLIYARWSLIHLSYQDFKIFLQDASTLLNKEGKIFISVRAGNNLKAINQSTKLGSLELNQFTLQKALPSNLQIDWVEKIKFLNGRNQVDYQLSFILSLKI